MYLRAIGIMEKAHGPDHPHLASGLNGRAQVLKAQGNRDEARFLFEKALDIQRMKLGEAHQNTILTMNALKDLDESPEVGW
ncbi:unnamed protein product [Scytosiphon promiscuus]